MKKIRGITLTLAITVLAPALAYAHPQHSGTGFIQGFVHPLLGFDHLLAMIAVGVWAAQVGGRTTWILPGAFVTAMFAGSMLGLAGFAVPMVEPVVAASVLVLGLVIMFRIRVSVPYAASLAAVFALHHGAAHLADASATVNLITYGAGFTMATTLLHLTGIFAALAFRGREIVLRLAGAPVGLAGAWMLVSNFN